MTALGRTPLTPNQVTVVGVALTFLAAGLVALRHRLPAGDRHQHHRPPADPRGLAAGSRAAPGAGARGEGQSGTRGAHADSMSGPFAGVVGHAQAVRQLGAQLANDRLAHAYLLVGEAGLGKATVARTLASALLPEAPLTRDPDYRAPARNKLIHVHER